MQSTHQPPPHSPPYHKSPNNAQPPFPLPCRSPNNPPTLPPPFSPNLKLPKNAPPADAPKTHRLYHLPVGHRHWLPIQRLLQGRTAYTKAGFTPGVTPQGLRPGYMPGWSSVCLPAGRCMSLLCPCFAPATPCSSPLCRPALHPFAALLFNPAPPCSSPLPYCTTALPSDPLNALTCLGKSWP